MLFVPPEASGAILSHAPTQTVGSSVKVIHSSARDQGTGASATAASQVGVQEDIGLDYLQRRTGNPAALGRFRWRKFGCITFLMSFDYIAWFFQGTFTALVIVGNMCVAWKELGWVEFLVCCTLCTVAFVSSWLVTSTDPGIYPRFHEGEADPLADKTTLVYCRKCRLRRPPRASHCYACDVCVLEHDHHCGIVGGCVGMRSLRWFTLFLVTASTACSMGLFWMLRHLFMGFFSPENVFGKIETTTSSAPPVSPLRPRRKPRPGEPSIDVTLSHIGAVFMILFDLIVILLVGSMACMYSYLTLTSTTRRESKRNQTSWRVLFRPTVMLSNLRRTAFPPASLLVREKKQDPTTAEMEQLV